MPPDSHDPDRFLVQRCLAWKPSGNTSGVASPWDEFIRIHAPAICRTVESVLRRFSSVSADAPDVAQEVLAILAHPVESPLRTFRWECPLSRYLTGVAVRHTFLYLRRHHREREALRLDVLLESLDSPALRSPDGPRAGDPGERVDQALRKLPPRERLAVQLAYWDDLPGEKAARILGTSPAAFWQLLSQARKRLGGILRSFPVVFF